MEMSSNRAIWRLPRRVHLLLAPVPQVAEARAALAFASPRPKSSRPALPSPPTFAAAGVVANSAAQNVAAQVVSDITQPLSLAQAAVSAAAAREKARAPSHTRLLPTCRFAPATLNPRPFGPPRLARCDPRTASDLRILTPCNASLLRRPDSQG